MNLCNYITYVVCGVVASCLAPTAYVCCTTLWTNMVIGHVDEAK